jgi:phosphate starvation-inducible PhoH-like protein
MQDGFLLTGPPFYGAFALSYAIDTASLNGSSGSKKKKDKIILTAKHLKPIAPLTENQKLTFKQWSKGYNLVLDGFPGVGKTFLALYLALRSVLDPSTPYDKLIIVRSLVETRKMGFLPGSKDDKEMEYELPYKQLCQSLFKDELTTECKDVYGFLKNQKSLEFLSTSFLRGTNFERAIVVVDEMQNLNYHELDTVITRLNESCRVIFCGDYKQSDFYWDDERKGILDFLAILKLMAADFATVSFQIEDCVRSGLVKRYLMAQDLWRRCDPH